MKLVVTKGNVASGKSTYAKEWFYESPQDRIIVERDMIRAMSFNVDGKTRLSPEKEDRVTLYQDDFIVDHLTENYSVIVSDTNLFPNSIRRFRTLAMECGAEFEVVDFTDVPLEVCIERNSKREGKNKVPEHVLLRMNKRIKNMKKYNKVEKRPFVGSSEKENAIMFDLDGTVRLMNGRSPYASNKAVSDMPNVPVIAMIQGMRVAYPDLVVIAISGANGNSYDVAVEQLVDFGIEPDFFFIRNEGDDRKDSIIKAEIYDNFIEPYYNVMFVVDDRNQVVDMWREKGLHCFQVAPGDF